MWYVEDCGEIRNFYHKMHIYIHTDFSMINKPLQEHFICFILCYSVRLQNKLGGLSYKYFSKCRGGKCVPNDTTLNLIYPIPKKKKN